MLAVMCKRMEQLSKMLGPAVHCGKDTTHMALETNNNVQEELYKRIQDFPATLRRSRNKRNVASCWLTRLRIFSRGLKVALHLKHQQAFYGIQKK